MRSVETSSGISLRNKKLMLKIQNEISTVQTNDVLLLIHESLDFKILLEIGMMHSLYPNVKIDRYIFNSAHIHMSFFIHTCTRVETHYHTRKLSDVICKHERKRKRRKQHERHSNHKTA